MKTQAAPDSRFASALRFTTELIAAGVAAWVAWPLTVAAVVTVLAVACVVTEQPRWRWLSGTSGSH